MFCDEATRYARVTTNSLYRWIRAGRLPATKLGGRWRIHREHLDQLLRGEL